MAIFSCHVSIKLPPKISDGQEMLVPSNVMDACFTGVRLEVRFFDNGVFGG